MKSLSNVIPSIDDLIWELGQIELEQNQPDVTGDRHLRQNDGENEASFHTPPEGHRCSAPSDDRRFFDSWRMSWRNAKVLKRMKPELSIAWTNKYSTIFGGRIIITDAYIAWDCEELTSLINDINEQNTERGVLFKRQRGPKRISIPRGNIPGIATEITGNEWF